MNYPSLVQTEDGKMKLNYNTTKFVETFHFTRWTWT